jgi:hypothetical protein
MRSGRQTLQRWLLALGAVAMFGSSWAAPGFYSLEPHAKPFGAALNHGNLNKTLGVEDRIGVANGHFFGVGPDKQLGTPDDRRVRLYGVNLSYSANFPPADQARQIARRLRSLGFNAVRLHHLDSSPDATSETTNSVLLRGPYPSFNAKAVDRLKAFIRILRDEGIYTNLNLYVGYRFRPSVDGVPMVNAQDQALEPGHAAAVFHPRLVALQVKYAQELIRQLDLANNPALAMVEIRNESSLASLWQSWNPELWEASLRGPYDVELTNQWNTWLITRYGTIAKACDRWKSCTGDSRQPLVKPEEADAARNGNAGTLGSALGKLRSVLNRFGAGESADPATTAPQRLLDFADFVADVDRKYLNELKRVVRAATHNDLPVTGTQMGYGGRLNFLSHADMDYVDEHFYVDHYQFPNTPWDYYDWRIKDSSLTEGEMQTLTGLSRHRDLRRPFVVSEYNQGYPNRRSAEIMPAVALYASLQDWDGLFFFDYVDGDAWGVLPSGFRLAGDWAKLAVTGQAATLFRAAQIAPAPVLAPERIDRQGLLGIGALRQRERRGISEAGPISWHPEKAFGQQQGILLDVTRSASAIAKPTSLQPTAQYSEARSQLTFNGNGVLGFTGLVTPGQRIDLGDAAVEVVDAQKDFLTLMLSALDGKPVRQSRHLLATVPGQVLGAQPGTLPARPKRLIPYAGDAGWWTLEPDAASKGKPSGAKDAQAPLWMERTPVKLTLNRPASSVQVFPLATDGTRLAPLPHNAIMQGAQSIELNLATHAVPQSPWYEIVLAP